MKSETWELLDQYYQRFPSCRGQPVTPQAFEENFAGYHVPADYREYILRFGGGLVGAEPIYGLNLADAMGTFEGQATAPAITKAFRGGKWPAVNDWLVFSTDGFGNPIGLTKDGTVCVSDGARLQVQQLAEGFEEFLLVWCLRIKPVRLKD